MTDSNTPFDHLSGGSSVGRAPRPRDTDAISPGQDEVGFVEQNASKPSPESDRVPSLISEGKEASTGGGREAGNGDENLGVGGSNPSHRTNLPATWTPDWLADDMVALARIRLWDDVLEPSAGYGSIVQAIHRVQHGSVTAVELNDGCVAALRDMNCIVRRGDFLGLEFQLGNKFDRVVMNPPLTLPSKHVLKAAFLLRPSGRLVALVHRSVANNLRAELPEMRRYDLPSNTFVLPNVTGQEGHLHSSIIVWDKP